MSSKCRDNLDDVWAFLGILRDLWGILAAVSLLFPVCDLLIRFVPIGTEFSASACVLAQVFSVLTALFIGVGRVVLKLKAGRAGAPST